MQTARCPFCGSDVVIEDEAYEGDLADCSNCGKRLEVISLHPPQIAKIKEEDNDFDE